MKIFVGTDHNGYPHKDRIVEYLKKAGYDVSLENMGPLNPDDDYPVFAKKVVLDMQSSGDKEPRGILVCGSGQGMCMAANRYKGIRAALGYDFESIRSARNDDDANVLCMSVHTLQQSDAMNLIDTFLKTPFAAATRFSRRIQEMDEV